MAEKSLTDLEIAFHLCLPPLRKLDIANASMPTAMFPSERAERCHIEPNLSDARTGCVNAWRADRCNEVNRRS